MDFEQILKYFKEILEEIVIKYKLEADSHDTNESVLLFERYKICKEKLDNIRTHATISVEILMEAGLSEDDAQEFQDHPYDIPDDEYDIEAILELHRRYVIEEYETGGTYEGLQNSYYRMLIGLPDLSETEEDFFYAPEYIAEKYDINTDTPIHLLNKADIEILREDGFIDELIRDNSSKKYLHFLGYSALDLFSVVEARAFSLLYCPPDLPTVLHETFLTAYEAARDFVVHVFYVREFEKKYPKYERFIGMMITVTALFRIINNLFINVIENNFFDIKSIIMFLNSYGIPYVESLQFEYQKVLAANANYLMRIKSRDEVLTEISTLLGFKNAKISKFYLVKEHRMDENENPVFYYKEKTDESGNVLYDNSGNPIMEYDYEKMFDIYFQEIDIDEKNVQMALSDSSTKIGYEEMVSNDPYWIDDEELSKFIRESDYNYEVTKYIGVNVTYKLSEAFFEVIYTLKMLGMLKDSTSNVTIMLESVVTSPVSLFDTLILILALTCIQNGFKGMIATSASKVSIFYGFNFTNDLPEIRKFITETHESNPSLLNDEDYKTIMECISKTTIVRAEDINVVFNNIRNLSNFLIEKMNNAKDSVELNFYKKIYRTLMTTKTMEDLFLLPSGKVAETYLEYLDYNNHALYAYCTNLAEDDISSSLTYILNKLSVYCEDIIYLKSINDDASFMSDILKKFINFFKSYTSDLASMGTVYLLNSKYYNFLRLTDEIKGFEKTIQLDDQKYLTYADYLHSSKTIQRNDRLKIRDCVAAMYYDE